MYKYKSELDVHRTYCAKLSESKPKFDTDTKEREKAIHSGGIRAAIVDRILNHICEIALKALVQVQCDGRRHHRLILLEGTCLPTGTFAVHLGTGAYINTTSKDAVLERDYNEKIPFE